MPEHVDDFARKQLIAVLKNKEGNRILEQCCCSGCCDSGFDTECCDGAGHDCAFCIFDETGRKALLEELEASTSN